MKHYEKVAKGYRAAWLRLGYTDQQCDDIEANFIHGYRAAMEELNEMNHSHICKDCYREIIAYLNREEAE